MTDVPTKLKNLIEAVDFYKRVVASPQEERIAVGRDHIDWLEKAAFELADVARAASGASTADPEYAAVRRA